MPPCPSTDRISYLSAMDVPTRDSGFQAPWEPVVAGPSNDTLAGPVSSAGSGCSSRDCELSALSNCAMQRLTGYPDLTIRYDHCFRLSQKWIIETISDILKREGSSIG